MLLRRVALGQARCEVFVNRGAVLRLSGGASFAPRLQHRADAAAYLTPCFACQRCMNAISSFCALMMLCASRFSSGSLPYFNSTCAISIAP